MTRKELKIMALAKIREGKSRQEVYDELREETSSEHTEIASVARNTPTLVMRDKYRSLNIILGIMSSLVILIDLLGIVFLIMMGSNTGLFIILVNGVVYSIITYHIFKFNARIYVWVIVFASISILLGLIYLSQDTLAGAVNLVMGSIMLTLSIILRKGLAPGYEETMIPYKNSKGEDRMKLRAVFKERSTVSDDTLDSFIRE